MKAILPNICSSLSLNLLFSSLAIATPLEVTTSSSDFSEEASIETRSSEVEEESSGVISNWLGLDSVKLNFHDPETGNIQITLDVFENSRFGIVIKTTAEIEKFRKQA